MPQPRIPATPKGVSLAGKTAVITGGNTGLGYETARQYLVLGAARVIIAVRSRSKGDEAAASLRSATRSANPEAVVDVFDLDLDDFDSVIAFANKVKSEVTELDILLLNGGVSILNFQRSASGHERVMQVNLYSNAVLALELLPLLRSTAILRGEASRLTIVSSLTLYYNRVAQKPLQPGKSFIEYFDNEREYSRLTRYSDSKLGVAAFVQEAAARVPASELIINAPCPGLVSTGIDKYMPRYIRPLALLYRKIAARDVDEGARTFVYATVVAGAETHGKFLQHNKIDPGAPVLVQPAGKVFSERLWSDMLAETFKLNSDFVEP